MSRKFGDVSLIYSWMRNRNTLEFLGIREQILNSNFKDGEFETFKDPFVRIWYLATKQK
jgi:hypothetical protein